MSCCPPSCAIPTCLPPSCASSSYPIGGLGSLSSCSSPCGALSLGGGPVSAASLGIASGASVGCVCQTPPSELMIQPAPICVTLPGAVLASTCEPMRVGGYTACGGGSSGTILSSGSGLLGSKQGGLVFRPC